MAKPEIETIKHILSRITPLPLPEKSLEQTIDNLPQSNHTMAKKKSVKKRPPIKRVSKEDVDILPCTKLDDLINPFSDYYHLTDDIAHSFYSMLAVVVSTTLEGDQTWLRVIAPPSSIKSVLCEHISADREHVYRLNKFTGFHSGWKETNSDTKNYSLIKKVENKTVVTKDADILIEAPKRNEIMSELRDLYDKTANSQYKNNQGEEYINIKMTYIMGATPAIRPLDKSLRGARFLDICINADEQSREIIGRKSIRSTKNLILSSAAKHAESIDDSYTLPRKTVGLTIGYIHHLKQTIPKMVGIDLSDDTEDVIYRLADFICRIRAETDRARNEDLLYRPQAELPARVGNQLTKLALCLAHVMNKQEVDTEVISILRKITVDTLAGIRLEVIKYLCKKPSSIDAIRKHLKVSDSQTRRFIEDLKELGLIEHTKQPNGSGRRGRNYHLYKVPENLKATYKELGL